MAQYSNFRALKAMVLASLQAILKSPSAIIFSFAFPLVFILVFGFLGTNGNFSIKVINGPGNDTTTAFFARLKQIKEIKWVHANDTQTVSKILSNGEASAVLYVTENANTSAKQKYSILLDGTPSDAPKVQRLKGILQELMIQMDPELMKRVKEEADVTTEITDVKELKMIDFILPGQLGFSLLAGSVFGTAFVFFNMRQTLVLKRFFATPVRREIIVLSEGIARMFFQLINAWVIISIGYFAFDYTLMNGFVTLLNMLVISSLSIMIFMGFGFTISGIAKSESAIPPFSNLITLPQFLLAGSFFPIDNFPKWLQPICRALPLSFLNDAMRRIAFNGENLIDVRMDILWLVVWGILVYALAARVFKWE